METMIPLRILCLHDAHSNAPWLKEQLGPLGKKLYEQHGMDLVYVNSPIVALLKSNNDDDARFRGAEKEEARVWWEEIEQTDGPFRGAASEEQSAAENATPTEDDDDEDDDDDAEKVDSFETESNTTKEKDIAPKIQYRGLDASLMLIKQIWNSTPFFGIIGVGQGAAVASIFLSMLESENFALAAENEEETENLGDTAATFIPPSSRRQQAPPQFAIFVCGESLVPVEEPILDTTDLPILHLVSAPRPTAKEERLCQQFRGKVEQRTATSTANTKTNSSQNATTTVLDRHDWNIMGRFVVHQKKRLFGCTAVPSNTHNGASSNNNNINNNNAQSIVALQTALHLAEQQAADAIAETIALNPPAALMAVIRPQQVSGWNGTKRREFGAEGGGAPCPSEFLLHRQQRASAAASSAENGPSRVHPSNNKAAFETEQEAASPAT